MQWATSDEDVCKGGVYVEVISTHNSVEWIYYKTMYIRMCYTSQGDSSSYDACSLHLVCIPHAMGVGKVTRGEYSM